MLKFHAMKSAQNAITCFVKTKHVTLFIFLFIFLLFLAFIIFNSTFKKQYCYKH